MKSWSTNSIRRFPWFCCKIFQYINIGDMPMGSFFNYVHTYTWGEGSSLIFRDLFLRLKIKMTRVFCLCLLFILWSILVLSPSSAFIVLKFVVFQFLICRFQVYKRIKAYGVHSGGRRQLVAYSQGRGEEYQPLLIVRNSLFKTYAYSNINQCHCHMPAL